MSVYRVTTTYGKPSMYNLSRVIFYFLKYYEYYYYCLDRYRCVQKIRYSQSKNEMPNK